MFCCFYSIFDKKILLANTVDPDQMPHYVASDLGLHCLPIDPIKGFQIRKGLKTIHHPPTPFRQMRRRGMHSVGSRGYMCCNNGPSLS